MNKWLIFLLAGLLACAGCATKTTEIDHRSGTYVSKDPEAEARAVQMNARTWIAEQNAAVDLELRKLTTQAEIETARAQATAGRQIAVARGNAWSQVILVLGRAAAIFIQALGYGLAIGVPFAIVLICGGWSVSYVRQRWHKSRYFSYAINPALPLLLVSSDGYLVFTHTGQRARLRDSQGVDQVHTAAMTWLAAQKQLADAQVKIAQVTKSPLPAESLTQAAWMPPLFGDHTAAPLKSTLVLPGAN